jgi:hypothetical protein
VITIVGYVITARVLAGRVPKLDEADAAVAVESRSLVPELAID